MCARNSVNIHINKVLRVGNLLEDLGQPIGEEMLITKIMCSLPPSFNSIVAAWTNVPANEQTVANLKVRLLQMENLLALQANESTGDAAFFTRPTKSSSKHKKPHSDHNKEYIKELKLLKSHTRCYNCGDLDHWTVEYPDPQQDKVKFSNHKKNRLGRSQRDTRGKRSEACTVTTEQPNSGSSNPSSESDTNSCAFMITNRRSHALSVNLDKQASNHTT